jgi:hypothetical protein
VEEIRCGKTNDVRSRIAGLRNYFKTCAIALATTSRLRVLSAATQMRPVLTA